MPFSFSNYSQILIYKSAVLIRSFTSSKILTFKYQCFLPSAIYFGKYLDEALMKPRSMLLTKKTTVRRETLTVINSGLKHAIIYRSFKCIF